MSGGQDPLLAELRARATSGDAVGADRELGRLLADEAAPILWRVIRSQLPDQPPAEQEEVHGDALLRLTTILQRLAGGDPELEIESFRAYVHATAANGCRALLRARHPERTRLQNQLRYALRHDSALALWEGAGGTAQCGLAAWRERDPASFAAAPAAGERREPFVVERRPGLESPALPELLRHLFLSAGRPLGFAELTAAMAEALGVRDLPARSLSEGVEDDVDEGGGGLDLAEERPGADRALVDREYLARLWGEIRELPRPQRVALLLNLRDDQGRDRLRLFPVTGVAPLAEISRTLEIERGALAAIWDELPLDDRTIAERLELTQRQVINLRKSARARLARRMARSGDRPPAR